MQELIFITDLDLSKYWGAGIGLYMKNLLSNIKGYETLMVGKNNPKKVYKADKFFGIVATNNYGYLMKLIKADKSFVGKESILISQRPDFMFPFRRLPNRKIITVHGNPAKILRKKKGLLTYWLYRFFERPSLRTADKVIFIDSLTHDEYIHRYPWLADKAVIIPPGFNSEYFKPRDKRALRKKLGIALNSKVLMFSGRLEPEKNHETIIEEIVSAEDRYYYFIAGDGSLKDKLEGMSNDRVKFLGQLDNKKIVDYMNASDATVIMSYSEGVPTMVLEGFACGKPVITNGAGELSTIVKNGKNGFIIEEGGIVRAMDKVNVHMKADCIKTAKKYEWKKIAKLLVKQYIG